MTKSKSVLGWVVALVVILGIAAFFGLTSKATSTFGSYNGGITNYDNLVLNGTLIEGNINSTSTNAATLAVTLAQSDILGVSTLSYTSATSVATVLTLPASSTLTSLIPKAGDVAYFTVINASTTGGTLALASSTGSIVKTSTTTVSAIISAGGVGVIHAVRKANSDIVFSLSLFNN